MSKYESQQTELDGDEGCLVAALQEMGFSPQVYAEPHTLMDYHGSPRPEKATVVIGRHNTGIGASNDIGFIRVDGKYQAIISEYDRGAKFNSAWLTKLADHYAIHKTMAVAKKNGYYLKSRTVLQNGKTQLKFDNIRRVAMVNQ